MLPRLLTRLLAASALLEAAAGLFETRRSYRELGTALRLPESAAFFRTHLGAEGLAHAAMAFAAVCNASFLASALLLWRRTRSGLVLMTWTLFAEACFFAAFLVAPVAGRSLGLWRGWGVVAGVVIGVGAGGLAPQQLTAYPPLAALAALLVYRSAGLPVGESCWARRTPILALWVAAPLACAGVILLPHRSPGTLIAALVVTSVLATFLAVRALRLRAPGGEAAGPGEP